MIEASAPGNLFFGGEHRIVYGGSAIITSVDMRTYSSIAKRRDDRVKIFSEGYGKIDERLGEIVKRRFEPKDFKKDEMNLARYLIKRYEEYFIIPSGFEMFINSDIPKTCSGLSRSTSFLCSAFKALDTQFSKEIKYRVPLQEKAYFYYILPLQKQAHGGSASGVEIISSVYGGFHKVKNNGSKEDLGKHEFSIVIGDTGIEAKTSETVPYVRRGWENDKESYEEVFKTIDYIIEEEIKAIKNDDVKYLGELINQNHEILAKDLGVSHPKLNKLVNTCRKAGAHGAKLSGGGKGGVMFALTEKENQYKIKKAILSVGGKPYTTKIGVEGLRIESN